MNFISKCHSTFFSNPCSIIAQQYTFFELCKQRQTRRAKAQPKLNQSIFKEALAGLQVKLNMYVTLILNLKTPTTFSKFNYKSLFEERSTSHHLSSCLDLQMKHWTTPVLKIKVGWPRTIYFLWVGLHFENTVLLISFY